MNRARADEDLESIWEIWGTCDCGSRARGNSSGDPFIREAGSHVMLLQLLVYQ